MGKKKKKNVDFQKVKLKVGKRLPKGLNVTDTSFKAKKIILPNQTKRAYREEPGAPAQKQLIIEELLKKLMVYNPSSKHDILTRLKELLMHNTELILPNLCGITNRVAATMVDKDHVVRRSANQVLTIVLQNVKEQEISPFFPILCSHLSCAMTHIDSHIKQDSLQFFNVMLDTFPSLLLKSSDKIMKNFLDQISSENTQSGARTLSVTPGLRITNQSWRLRVLRRLEKLLSTLVKQVKAREDITDAMERMIFWDGDRNLCLPLYPPAQLSDDVHSPAVTSKWTTKQFHSYASLIMPLLFEIWVEAYSTESSALSEKNKTPDAMEMLDCMLHIMRLLGEWLEQLSNHANNLVAWFKESYYGSFNKYFMKDFPHSDALLNPKKKTEKPVSLQAINLALVSFYYFLLPETKNEGANEDVYQPEILKYLRKLLSKGKAIDQSQITEVIKIAKQLLRNEDERNSVSIMHALWNLYHNWPVASPKRQLLFNFFVDVLLQHQFRRLLEEETVVHWLKYIPQELPDLTQQPIYFKKHIAAIHRLAARKLVPLVEGLQENAPTIIGLLFALPTPTSKMDHIQKDVLDLIVKIPELSFSHLRCIVEAICTGKIAFFNLKCFLQNLSYKFPKRPNVYINFMLSIVMGTSSFRCESSIPIDESYLDAIETWVPRCLCLFDALSCKAEVWMYHLRIVEEVCNVLSHAACKDVSENISYLLDVIAESEEILPIHSASGITFLELQQFTVGNMDNFNDRFIEVILALCIYCFVQRKNGASGQDLEVVDKIQVLVLDCIKAGNLSKLFCERVVEVTEVLCDTSRIAEFVCYWFTMLLKHANCDQPSLAIMHKILDEIKKNSQSLSFQELWWKALIYELSRHWPKEGHAQGIA